MTSLEREKINKSLGKICKVGRCNRGTWIKGYCGKHYTQKRLNGKISKEENELMLDNNGKCKVTGCNEKYAAKGYCIKHYRRWKKYGDPNKGAFKPKGVCSVDRCNRPHASNGYCQKHWMQIHRRGRILESHEEYGTPYISKTGLCEVPGCNNKHVTKGLCQRHHTQACKEKAVEYKGGKCQVCGYNKYFGALDFHHKNPKNKDFVLGQWIHDARWEKVKIELDKCILVCSNCHREIHYKQFELEKAA